MSAARPTRHGDGCPPDAPGPRRSPDVAPGAPSAARPTSSRPPAKRTARHIESQIQSRIVEWFARAVPEDQALLFAVPNGGRRDRRTGAILKREGARAGAPDLVVLLQGGRTLLWETKRPALADGGRRGALSAQQRDFARLAQGLGHQHQVLYSEWDAQDALQRLGLRLRFTLVGPRPKH
jgi:hypothetical protein